MVRRGVVVAAVGEAVRPDDFDADERERLIVAFVLGGAGERLLGGVGRALEVVAFQVEPALEHRP